MKSRFDEFIEKIPKNIHNNTKTFIGKNIAIFIPDEFVIGRKMIMEDYHFIVFHTTPPSCIINNKEIQYKKGSLVCLPPGTEIILKSVEIKSPVKYVSLSVNRGFFENVLMRIGEKKDIEFKKFENYYSYKLLDFIEAFIHEFNYFEENSSIMLESMETQIVIQLLRDSDLDPAMHRVNRFQDSNYVQQAIKYIENYYSSNITINEICNNIYISPCHFQRIFKNTINKTPYQYIMEVRLNKAKEMLQGEEISISEVARLTGFLSSGHFSTVFKRIEGKTPSEYRVAAKL